MTLDHHGFIFVPELGIELQYSVVQGTTALRIHLGKVKLNSDLSIVTVDSDGGPDL